MTKQSLVEIQDAVLSQGEPRDAGVNFDTYRILQRHRAVSVLRHGFTARQHSRAQSAVLGMIDSVCPSVCLSVCLSHAGIMPKRLKLGSWGLHFVHMIISVLFGVCLKTFWLC